MQRRTVPLLLSFTVTAALAATGTAHPAPPVPAPPAQAAEAPAARAAEASAVAGSLVTQDLATRGQGAPVYRIPALTRTVKGTLVAAYDARPSMADLPANISVVIRRSTDGGATWQTQQTVRSEPAPHGNGDPSLLVDRETGRIFVFYSSTVNRGFAGSETGNDESNPNIQQADYSYSDDDGLTWKHERITAEVKNPAWAGMFAASGEGIQLRQGPHRGRLIQQYAVRADGANRVVSVYSDDHGATWKAGTPTAGGGDENKTVELSDGRILLNNRSAPHRTIAHSSDGGVTYTPFQRDTALPDPANNGSITRFAPDVPADHPRAKWLLFSNTEDTGIRRNLTVKMSCDDGRTWPIRKVVNTGASAYSTLTPLSDGIGSNPQVGMLWEREGYQHMSYSSFDLKWLGGICAPVTVTAPAQVKAGERAQFDVRVVNQNDRALPAGSVGLDLPAGWNSTSVAVPALNPGQGATVKVAVDVPPTATGTQQVKGVYSVRDAHSYGTGTAAVTPAAGAPAAPRVSALPVLDHLQAAGAAGTLGDTMVYWIRVANPGNTTLTQVELGGNLGNLAACARATLAPGAEYVCKGGTRTVTRADLDQGFAPELTVSGTAPDGSRTSAPARGDRTELH
ncbi:exo-alpha-sialidase [Streptomyces prasinus]|uniref:exo-alpha-sialidase n=1 Tax=Streptomyces prasinus TaxID=67345 RepID=UPI003D9F60A5